MEMAENSSREIHEATSIVLMWLMKDSLVLASGSVDDLLQCIFLQEYPAAFMAMYTVEVE